MTLPGASLLLLVPSRRRGIDALRAHSSSSTSLRLLPSPSSLHPRLVYHSLPIPPPSSSTSTDDDGTYTATISLSAIVDAPLAGAGAAAGSDPARPYVALLSPAVPLSRRTAREVCEALELGLEGATSATEEAQGARERDDEEDVKGWVGALLEAQGGLERARTEGNAVVRALPLSRASRVRADAPLRTDPPRLPAALLHPRALASLPPFLIFHSTLSTRSLARTRTRTAPRRDAPPLRARRAARRRARRPRRPDARQRARAQRHRAACAPGSTCGSRWRGGEAGEAGEGAGRAEGRDDARRALCACVALSSLCLSAQRSSPFHRTCTDPPRTAAPSPNAPPAPLPISVHPTSSPRGPGVTLTFPLPPPSRTSPSTLTSTSTSPSAAAYDPTLAGAPLALELVSPYACAGFEAALHVPPALRLAALDASGASGGVQAGEGAEEEERERAARARLERRLERVAQVGGGDAGLVVREVLRRVGAAMERRASEEGGEGGV